MKVANITLHAVNNYGSILQTYATEYLFRMLGCDVLTIDYVRKTLKMTPWDVIKAKRMPLTLKAKTLISMMLIKGNEERATKFRDFRKSHLTLTKRYSSNEELKMSLPEADVYCTGSDQTWNTVCQGDIPKAFFLDFVPPEKKKISFAASFGIKELPKEEIDDIKTLLSKYNSISVREQSGVDIIESLGLHSTLVLDPTLAVPNEVWDELAAPRMFKEDYILAYKLNRSSRFTKYMRDFAKSKGLKLVLVRSRKEINFVNCTCLTSVGPQEWLSLIKNAKYVLTDSFHCTAFCILFHRQFMCILPPSYSDRIVNILQETGLTNRISKDADDYYIFDGVINYNIIDKWLLNKREQTNNFLKHALAQ